MKSDFGPLKLYEELGKTESFESRNRKKVLINTRQSL